MGASILGYFVGKFSYADTCADKFLVEAPNSNIAQAIRRRRGIAPLENTEGVEVIQAPGRSDFFFTKVFGDGILAIHTVPSTGGFLRKPYSTCVFQNPYKKIRGTRKFESIHE